MRRSVIHKYAQITKAARSTGNVLENVKDARDAFDRCKMEHVGYAGRCFEMKDSMDMSYTTGS